MSQTETAAASLNAHMKWRHEVAVSFPELARRTIDLRGASYALIVNQQSLEDLLVRVLKIATDRLPANEFKARQDKQIHKQLVDALEILEWSARNGAADPLAKGAPWNSMVSRYRPDDIPGSIERVCREFLVWAENAKAEHAVELARVLALIDAHGSETFGDYFRESGLDFSSWLMNQALPVYGDLWVKHYPAVDTFYSEKVYRGGYEMMTLAMFRHQGAEKVVEVMESLAPARVPAMPAP